MARDHGAGGSDARPRVRVAGRAARGRPRVAGRVQFPSVPETRRLQTVRVRVRREAAADTAAGNGVRGGGLDIRQEGAVQLPRRVCAQLVFRPVRLRRNRRGPARRLRHARGVAQGPRLCTHRLLPATAANRYSTNETDLPGKAGWRQWDRERCERWAKHVGPDCADVVGRLFAARRFDDQGVEPALAVLRLSRRYSERRLENACSLALQSVASPRYSHIRPILETGQDMTGGLTETSDDGAGGWVRGGDYYANMGRRAR